MGNNKGFTMIELVAVLVILGIIAAVVAVRMTGTTDYDLVSQVEVVKAHLRLTQSRAMTTGRPWGITFTGPNPTTYYLFQEAAPATPVLLPGEDNVTVNLTTKKSALTISPLPLTITFDAYGSPGAVDISVTTNGGNFIVRKNTGFIQ